jgi:predicted secreted protein
MKACILGLLVLWQLLGLPAQAATPEPEASEDQVSFQVDVERDVENDRAVATLSATAEDRDPARLAQHINEAMSWALEQLRGQTVITTRSGTYRTYPVYDDRKIVRWRAVQELQLESGDIERLARMIGVLQEHLQVQAMQFLVSAAERREVESALTEEALLAFRQRAEVIRKALGASGYRLVDVNINSGGPRSSPLMRAEVMSASRAGVASPALEQGTSSITVQVNGRIRLLRD